MFQDIETFNKMIFSLMQITNLTSCILFTDYSKRKIDIFCNIQMLCKHVKVKSPSTDLLYSGRLRLGEGDFTHFFLGGGGRGGAFSERKNRGGTNSPGGKPPLVICLSYLVRTLWRHSCFS